MHAKVSVELHGLLSVRHTQTEMKHPVTAEVVGRRLKGEQLRRIRKEMLGLIAQIVSVRLQPEGMRKREAQAMMRFLSLTAGDTRQQEEVLELLLTIFAQRPDKQQELRKLHDPNPSHRAP